MYEQVPMTFTTFNLSIDLFLLFQCVRIIVNTQFSIKIWALTAVIMKSANYCDVTQCSLVEVYLHL
jgi:hypothetical protein